MWDGRATVDNIKIFVGGPVSVDWTKKNLNWHFRYKTSASAAVPGKARWEMSRGPFPGPGPWKPTPGFAYTGAASGTQFSIDLDPYAPRPPGWVKTVSVKNQPQPLVQTTAAGSGQQKPPTSSPMSGLPNDLEWPQPEGMTSSPQLSTGILASLSLYVRVVPLDAAGNDADLPSNAVELRFGPVEKAPPFNLDPKVWPKITLVGHRPIQGYTFDYQCWVKSAKDITVADIMPLFALDETDGSKVMFPKGMVRNTCDDDDGNIVDDVVDAVGGFIELFESFVNGVSSAFDSIKSFAASTIASAIPGCAGNSLCEGAVMAGINSGLVALGMPPDLPDFEQLQAMGEDYLAEAIAQQVAAQTGLPGADVATKAAVKEMIAKTKEAAESGGGSSLWIPDDGHRYKPMLIVVSASNPASSPSAAMYLELSEPGGAHYVTSKVAVPSLAPGESLKIAIALQPVDDPEAWMQLLPVDADPFKLAANLEKVLAAKNALSAWRAKYLKGTVTITARLTLPPFVGKDVWQTSCFADKVGCLVP